MSDQFTFSLPCSRNSSSSINLDRGDFTWKAGILRAADGETLLTLSCRPTDNKETLLWRCDANVEIEIDFIQVLGNKTNCAFQQFNWSVLFNSHMKGTELKRKLCRMRTDAVRIEIKTMIVRCFIIDLSSPTNAFIPMPSDAARFEIAGRVVYLSKNMLTRCSPFFDAMFNRDFLEKSTDSYALREVKFHQVMNLMAIVHRKTALIDASSVGYLATLADMYDVREVAELCRDFLRFHKDKEVENRDIISERCDYFRQERTVIETKIVKLELPDTDEKVISELEIGAFHCRLKLIRYIDDYQRCYLTMNLSPVKNDRNVLWSCVIRSSATSVDGNDFVEKQHTFSYRKHHSVVSPRNQNDNFCMKLIESNFIDLSSPENEFIKDPADAVCLEVDGEKLWFSKHVLTLSCASFCDLFKETKDVYIIDDVDFIGFLHFTALLHSHKFEFVCGPRSWFSSRDLLKMADRFRCGYMIDRVGYPGC